MNFKQWLILSEAITVDGKEFRQPLDALKYIQNNHPNPENLFITFTAIDKVGINPKSQYDTPLGIYFYPLDYVVKNEMNVEFAGNQPYINLCEFIRPDKILHMNPDIENQKGLELLDIFPKEEVDAALRSIEEKYELRSDYSKLWLVTKELASDKPILWNANLRKCGIDGFVDHGTKTIHRSEPTQGVVLTGTSLKRILVIPQVLFSKQGDSIPVRKTSIDISKIPKRDIEKLFKNRIITNSDVIRFISYSSDRDKAIKIIIHYKKELSSDNVHWMFEYAVDKDEIGRELGPDNINKLSENQIGSLIYSPNTRNKILRIIVGYRKEIPNRNIKFLLGSVYSRPEIEEMAEILGSGNINKLSHNDFSQIIDYSYSKDLLKSVLRNHYTGSDSQIISLLTSEYQ
jgi:hypothetical protein